MAEKCLDRMISDLTGFKKAETRKEEKKVLNNEKNQSIVNYVCLECDK